MSMGVSRDKSRRRPSWRTADAAQAHDNSGDSDRQEQSEIETGTIESLYPAEEENRKNSLERDHTTDRRETEFAGVSIVSQNTSLRSAEFDASVDNNALKPSQSSIERQQLLTSIEDLDASASLGVNSSSETTILTSNTITTRPTLLPNATNRGNVQSPRSSSAFGIETSPEQTRTNSSDLSTFNPYITTENASLTRRQSTTVSELQRASLDDLSTAEDLSRISMGYSANASNNPLTRSGTGSASDKMDPSTPQTSSERTFNSSERKDREDDGDDTTIQSMDSATVGSPVIAPLYEQAVPTPHTTQPLALETPSTISTAPSTDDASLGEHHAFSFGEVGGVYSHRRVPSWEASPRQTNQYLHFDPDQAFGSHAVLPPPYAPQPAPSAWGSVQGTQRVTSFRGEHEREQRDRYGYHHPMTPNDIRWQQQQQQQQLQQQEQQQQRFAPQLPFLPPGRGTPTVDNRMYRHSQGNFSPYPTNPMLQRKPSGGYTQTQPLMRQPSATPPRGGGGTRGQQRLAHSPHHHRLSQTTPGAGPGGGGQSPGNVRLPSEILKTLLRKKACLYEPDTSRAVALVTWLVGRELALEYGYFSRQQLQAGVHACVAEKIDSGVITRTKVNRCMQIILNSCFHYIIPRPDGTEENGELFREKFASEVDDDSLLLRLLPMPWNDVVVDKSEVLRALSAEVEAKQPKGQASTPWASTTPATTVTPQSSPRIGSTTPEKGSPGKESADGDGSEQKRAVLLCFNENVRCAEDVFRCHNEFIRDTAHASNLQLSSEEWRMFFGREAASAPYLWGNIGVPVPFSDAHGPSYRDAVGMMTSDEAKKFRTSWCTKRYDHNHDLCGFGHVEVNGGWLRRNPAIHQYKDEMCPSITTISDNRVSPKTYVINTCPHGAACGFAHSMEEIVYHPRRYKMNTCSSSGRPGGCHLGDVCPNLHPVESYRFPKKTDGRSSRHTRHSHQASGTKGLSTPPSGAPILYASPAPMSSFEDHLVLPGLQNLYRRQCAVVRAHLLNSGYICSYSYFGDDTGVDTDLSSSGRSKPTRGLPNPTTRP